MTFDLDFPARAVFRQIHWPESAAVAGAIHRFTTERAPSLASGVYALREAGYAIRVRVDREAETVLVLYIHRAG